MGFLTNPPPLILPDAYDKATADALLALKRSIADEPWKPHQIIEFTTTVSAVDILNLGNAKHVRINGVIFPSADAVQPAYRLSQDNGASFIAASSYGYNYLGIDGSTTNNTTGTGTSAPLGNSAGTVYGTTLDVDFQKPLGAGNLSRAVSGGGSNYGAGTARIGFWNSWIGINTWNAVRIFFPSGNIAALRAVVEVRE
jgi:hypothetical protein